MTSTPTATAERTSPTTPLGESARAARLLLFGQASSKVMRLLTDLLLGRVLGPAGFGIVAASMSFTHILAEVGLVGTHRAVLRFASVDESEGRSQAAATLTRRALAVALLFGVSLFAAVMLVRRPLTIKMFGEATSPWILPLFALAIPAIGGFTVLQFRARAGRRFVEDTLVGNVARAGIPFFVTTAMFLVGWRLWGAAAGFVGGMIGTLGLAFVLRRRAERRAPGDREGARVAPVGMRRFLTVAVPLALASASVLLLSELDKVMLAIFRPETEVGIYNAGFRLSRQAIILLPVLNAAISPWVAPLLANGQRDDLQRVYRQTTRWSLAAGWSTALLFALFAQDFLGLFGDAYRVGATVLVMLSLGQFVNASVGNAGVILQFSGHERMELSNGLFVTIANVVLNLVLIPRFGAEGAAVATLLSLSFVAVRRLLQVRTVLGILPYDRKTLFVLGGGLLGATVSLGLRLAVGAAGGGALAGVIVVTFGMVAGWTILLMIVGVTEEEAALLRVPKRWVKRGH